MTDKQLQELHKDIESGLVMIVEKKHYYRLENSLARLIDLLKLPSLFPLLDTTEKYSIEIAEQALSPNQKPKG